MNNENNNITFSKKDKISFMYGLREVVGVVTAVFENIIRVKYDDLNIKELMIKKGFISYNKYELIDLILEGKIEHRKYHDYKSKNNNDNNLNDVDMENLDNSNILKNQKKVKTIFEY